MLSRKVDECKPLAAGGAAAPAASHPAAFVATSAGGGSGTRAARPRQQHIVFVKGAPEVTACWLLLVLCWFPPPVSPVFGLPGPRRAKAWCLRTQ